MIRNSLIAAALVVGFATPAFAFHCPLDGKAIDAGLASSSVSADVRSEIEALKDKGLGQHNDGDHEGGQTTLAEAMRLLLNNL